MTSTRIANVRHHTRNVLSMVAVAGTLLVGATGAQAAGGPLEPGRYRTAYQSATVSSGMTDANGAYLGTTISVFRSDAGTQVCVDSADRTVGGGMIVEMGCAPTADNAFTLDKKLASASLSPTIVTISQSLCEPVSEHEWACNVTGSRNVEVAATFTGEGEVETTKGRSSYNDGTYTYQFKGSGSFRAATGSLTVNDETQSGVRSLSTSKTLTVIRAK